MLAKKPSLKSGTLVTIFQARLDGTIYARRSPEKLAGSRGKTMNDIVITTIPNGSRALYMGTQKDAFNSALRAKGAGPFGYTPARLLYHFVLWEGRPVWVSSGDCALEEVNATPG